MQPIPTEEKRPMGGSANMWPTTRQNPSQPNTRPLDVYPLPSVGEDSGEGDPADKGMGGNPTTSCVADNSPRVQTPFN